MRLNEIQSYGVTLFHGGRNLESDYLEIRGNKSKQSEHGTGIYLISDISVARKYAKGGNSMYAVTIMPGQSAYDTLVDRDTALAFLKTMGGSPQVRKDIAFYINKRADANNDKVRAEQIFNLTLNYDLLTPAKSLKMRQFLISVGVDYFLVNNYGGSSNVMVVVVNPRVIKKVEKIKDDGSHEPPSDAELATL